MSVFSNKGTIVIMISYYCNADFYPNIMNATNTPTLVIFFNSLIIFMKSASKSLTQINTHLPGIKNSNLCDILSDTTAGCGWWSCDSEGLEASTTRWQPVRGYVLQRPGHLSHATDIVL